jgi:hypothetical protein
MPRPPHSTRTQQHARQDQLIKYDPLPQRRLPLATTHRADRRPGNLASTVTTERHHVAGHHQLASDNGNDSRMNLALDTNCWNQQRKKMNNGFSGDERRRTASSLIVLFATLDEFTS